jgi:hypothetical protein
MTVRRPAQRRTAASSAGSLAAPQWPRSTAVLHEDGSGELTINGLPEDFSADDVDAARVLVIERVSAFAREQLGRPVRLLTNDPDGRQFQLAVHPDGHVAELALPPTAAAKPIAPRRRRPRGVSRSRLPKTVLAVLLTAMLVCGGIIAIVLASSHHVRSIADHSSIARPRSTAPPRAAAARRQVKPRTAKPRRPQPVHRSPARSHYRSPRGAHARGPHRTAPSSIPTSVPASPSAAPAPAPAPARAPAPTPAPPAARAPASPASHAQPHGQFNF